MEKVNLDLVNTLLGAELRKVRQSQGLSRRTVVERLNRELSTQALANYEYGVRPCQVETFVDICNALGKNADVVLAAILERGTGANG